jgi:hypothetical protein
MRTTLFLFLITLNVNAADVIFPSVTCVYPDNDKPETYSMVKVEQSSLFLGLGQSEFFNRVCDEIKDMEKSRNIIEIKPKNFERYKI